MFAKHPVLSRAVIVICMALIGLALALSVSRGAMLGLAVVALAMGVLRYRRLLVLMGVVLLLALILPQTRALVEHFAAGFAGQDLATQMRFGEYRDALELIERYPVLGVGFIGTPDVDLYIGVSSMYLLVAQQMGVLGLLVFASVFIALFIGAARVWPAVRNDDRLSAIYIGAHGAVLGALFTGIFDHYFFNIDFHNSVMLLWSVIALAAATQISARESKD
jgi:O-antigen ligase